jgi:hypothetical protein
MRLVFQVAGGILLAVVVIVFVALVGSIKVPSGFGVAATPTAAPVVTVADQEIAALVKDCGINAADVRGQLDDGYAYMPAPAVAKSVAEQRMLDSLMPTVAGSGPHEACQQLSCPICMGSAGAAKP